MNYFWNSFYKKKTIIKPSSFAKYCYNNFLVKNKKILDIGCGNGGDTFYFEKKKVDVTFFGLGTFFKFKLLKCILSQN